MVKRPPGAEIRGFMFADYDSNEPRCAALEARCADLKTLRDALRKARSRAEAGQVRLLVEEIDSLIGPDISTSSDSAKRSHPAAHSLLPMER